MIRLIGKSGERSSGPTGCFVPGWSGGNGLLGISATMLYQVEGISFSSKKIFLFDMLKYLKC
jgi:hypothetical protein